MEISPWERKLRKIRFWHMVKFLEVALSKIVDDICPTALCLSDDNCIGVLCGFLR
jgi:hypothetical protein